MDLILLFWTRILRICFFIRKIYLKMIYGYENDFVAISNYRGEEDHKNFGYPGFINWLIKVPDVLSWIPFFWKVDDVSIRGRLFMISATFEQIQNIANDPENNEALKNEIKRKFCAAVDLAIVSGAKTILLAANTKRLFSTGELEALYPNVIFTLGDNFTGLLLGRRIRECYGLISDRKKKTIMVVAPYGMLGTVSLWYLLDLYRKHKDFKIVLMVNPKRKKLSDEIIKKYPIKFEVVFNYQDLLKKGLLVDMIVSCNSSRKFMPTPQDLIQICPKQNKKIIFVDPCEPYSMPPELYKEACRTVVRFDSGNGFSRNFKYFLSIIKPYSLLRLTKNEIWGCFCEGMIITRHLEDFRDTNLNSEPTIENINKFRKFYDEKFGFVNWGYSCYGKQMALDMKNQNP